MTEATKNLIKEATYERVLEGLDKIYEEINDELTDDEKEQAKEDKRKIAQGIVESALVDIITSGIELVDLHYKNVLTTEEIEQYEKDLKVVQDKWDSLTEESVKKLASKDASTQSMLSVSDHMMKCFHKIGNHFYQSELFDDAKTIYTTLIYFNPLADAYWFALGLTNRRLKEYKDAITAFLNAGTLNSNNPVPHLFIALCASEDGHPELAASELEIFDDLVEELDQSDQYKDIAQAIKQKIQTDVR